MSPDPAFGDRADRGFLALRRPRDRYACGQRMTFNMSEMEAASSTPQITTIANRKCMATPPLPKDHRDGDRRNYTPHETHRYYRVQGETYPRLNHLGDG
jgi:hypothetical protein